MTPRPRPLVERLSRTSVPQSGRYSALRLDKNERCAAWPAAVVRAMLRGLSGHHLAAYPEPGALYEKLAKHHGVGTDQIAVTAGSELAIRYLFEAFLRRRDEVVLLDPSFAMFEVYARLYGARPAAVAFGPHLDMAPERILRRIGPRTRIVALANPNNPTGTVLAEEALLEIVRRAAVRGALVLVDEAYFHFYGRTMMGHVPRHDNLIVTRTFSKAWGLAGLRLGYAVGPRAVIASLNRVQPIDHVSASAAHVGAYLLDHEELVDRYVRQTEQGQRSLVSELEKLGVPVRSGYGNFVLADLGGAKDRIVAELRSRGVLVGAALRLPAHPGWVRVTVGPASEMKRFLAVFRAAWAGRPTRPRPRSCEVWV